MPVFKDLLLKFDQTLQKYNPKNYAKLRSPLPGQEIEYYLDKLHVTHPDFRMLFEWKNGVDLSRGLSKHDKISEFGVLYPLESILEYTDKYPRKNRHLIDLFGNSSGDPWLFNNDKESDDYGKVFIYSVSLLSIDDPYSYFDSLHSMLETLIKAYKTGIYEYNDSADFLDTDSFKFWKLAKKLNPGSNYWQQHTIIDD